MSSEQISDEVMKQYEAIRLSGACNMFDIACVRHAAEELGFDELIQVIEEDNYTEILENYE